jgi:hypothetical protein
VIRLSEPGPESLIGCSFHGGAVWIKGNAHDLQAERDEACGKGRVRGGSLDLGPVLSGDSDRIGKVGGSHAAKIDDSL